MWSTDEDRTPPQSLHERLFGKPWRHPLLDLAPKPLQPKDCAPGTPGSAVPAMPSNQPTHPDIMAQSSPSCPPASPSPRKGRQSQELADMRHDIEVNGIRRQQELLEARHAVRLAVERWRAENPALASQWLQTPAGSAPAATNSVASAYRLNTSRDVAVATDTYWNEDMAAAPRGVKLQLLSIGGVAQYDTYKGEDFWVSWAPVPRRRPA